MRSAAAGIWSGRFFAQLFARGRCCTSDPRDLIGEATRWLAFARNDLASADALARNQTIHPRVVCWLAQQGTEKALEAALVRRGVDFPRTHDLDRLLNLLPESSSARAAAPDLSELTAWIIQARYPGDWPDPSNDDARRALAQAPAV